MESTKIEQYRRELSSLIDRVDPNKVVFGCDHDSDTLMIHFSSRGRPGVSLPVAQGWMLRLDRQTDELIGIQIAGMLARAARAHPPLLDVLNLAELPGVTPDEIDRVRREVAAPSPLDALLRILDGFPTAASRRSEVASPASERRRELSLSSSSADVQPDRLLVTQ
jgi:hypothetical protein